MNSALRAWAGSVALAVVTISLAGCGSSPPPPSSKPGSPLPPDMEETQKGMLEAAKQQKTKAVRPRVGR